MDIPVTEVPYEEHEYHYPDLSRWTFKIIHHLNEEDRVNDHILVYDTINQRNFHVSFLRDLSTLEDADRLRERARDDARLYLDIPQLQLIWIEAIVSGIRRGERRAYRDYRALVDTPQ